MFISLFRPLHSEYRGVHRREGKYEIKEGGLGHALHVPSPPL